MITGKVTDSIEPMLQVRVIGAGAHNTNVDAVIDTGFTGDLTLPQLVIQSLELQFHGIRKAQLADEQIVAFRVYRAAVDWNGQNRTVQVVEAGGSPLIAM